MDCNYDNAFYKNSLPNPLPEYEYIILSAYVSQYGLKDYEKCLEQLNQSNKFIKLRNYKLIDVFQRIRSWFQEIKTVDFFYIIVIFLF